MLGLLQRDGRNSGCSSWRRTTVTYPRTSSWRTAKNRARWNESSGSLSKNLSLWVAEIYSQETVSDPSTGNDHDALPVHVCNDKVPVSPEPAGNRQNSDRPDEETDLEPDLDVNVLPHTGSPGTAVTGRWGNDG